MPKAPPIYSAKPYAPHVYHDNTKYTERNNIEVANIRHGTGNRPLCEHCSRLNRAGQ